MRTKYEDWMDRQHVSPSLHDKLMNLEQPTKGRGVPLRSLGALAAVLAVVVGLWWFRLNRQFPAVRSAGAGAALSEEAAVMEAPAQAENSSVTTAGTAAAPEDSAYDEAAEDLEAEKPAQEAAVEEAAAEDDSEELRIDYVGDAPGVVRIALALDYPDGWVYDHVELQTDTPPYGLDIYLSGGTAQDEDAFTVCAERCLSLIGNLGVVRFIDTETGTVLAQQSK